MHSKKDRKGACVPKTPLGSTTLSPTSSRHHKQVHLEVQVLMALLDSSQLPTPPLPPSNNPKRDLSKSTNAPSSLIRLAASAIYMGWTTTDTRFKLVEATLPRGRKDLHTPESAVSILSCLTYPVPHKQLGICIMESTYATYTEN
ncbi:hypothetical protein Tco_0633340 [Tanacetum coccineum]